MRAVGRGVLVLVIGAGDTPARVIAEAARRCRGLDDLVFPRRVVSGPPLAGPELHQTVSPAQFEELRRNGIFSLVWGTGGRNYALPASVVDDLRRGMIVVAAAAAPALQIALRSFSRIAVAMTDSADSAIRTALANCDEVIELGPDPVAGGMRLAAYLDRDLAEPTPVRRPSVPWVGDGAV